MYVVDEKGQRIDGCTEHAEHYWRRNIFGGRTQADLLVAAGIGYWPKCDKPDFPSVEGAEYGEYDEDIDDNVPLNDAAREEQRLAEEYLKATYSEEPGISVYKLCDSNDGWWVTQAECKSALELWEKKGRPEVDRFGDHPAYNDTIPFLRAAAAHAGFRVW